MMAWLSLIPGISSLIQFVVGKAFETKVQLTMARLNCDQATAETLVKGSVQQDANNVQRLGVVAGNKILTFLVVAFAVPILIWFWKAVPIDKVWCPFWYGEACATDQIAGEALAITQTVIYFLFGAPAVMGLAKMFFTRDKTGE